ncbi:hypothetical protein B0T19DRAFT_432821 [Cercophora scortea]|uniref:Uncharacterized protein n=1 Tax=Cercophora scortea TaxID=314031 RepID=A0AAE0M5U3_9PEZI|nr:hypothetical protein B0T19DRAFT_432821 [Cercophora scortea]
MKVSGPAVFIIHIFINHDPFLASVFLPDLFSDFPDAAWRVPQRIPFPPRPAPPPAPQGAFDGAGGAYAVPLTPAPRPPYVHPREGLGRHVFDDPLPGSTTLQELFAIIERDLGFASNFFAAFTIFPQDPSSSQPRSVWHDKPLSFSMTMNEAWAVDGDALNFFPEKMQANAELHLVLETKGAALSRIVGTDFLYIDLGREFEAHRNVWNHLEAFNNAYYMAQFDFSDLRRALSKWRHAKYALLYLRKEKQKQQLAQADSDTPTAAMMTQDLDDQIEKQQRDKEEARASILTLVRWWVSWVRNQDDGPEAEQYYSHELPDESVEDAVQWVWSTKHEIVDNWKTSTRRNDLWNSLHESYLERHPWQRNVTTEGQLRGANTRVTEDVPSAGGATPIPATPEGLVKTHSIRDAAGVLLGNQSTFTVNSGVLLWGQLLPMYYGSLQEDFTNSAAVHVDMRPFRPRDSTKPYIYTYRSAARNGHWKIRRYYSNWRSHIGGQDQPAREHAGWIICHEDVDATEIIKRLEGLTPTGSAIGNDGNYHVDKDIRQICRYDWTQTSFTAEGRKFESKFQAYAEQAIGPAPPPSEDGVTLVPVVANINYMGYFTAIDADRWDLDYLRAYKHECEADSSPTVERIFEIEGGQAFGTYVRMLDTEMEFAWLIFSGSKHPNHNADELIAIVYDGAYEVFEGLYHAVEPEPGAKMA